VDSCDFIFETVLIELIQHGISHFYTTFIQWGLEDPGHFYQSETLTCEQKNTKPEFILLNEGRVFA